MEIPFSSLQPATLRALIEEFVTREGTDYGHGAYDLEAKVTAVMRQLQDGRARITFDPDTETCSIEPVT